ncbi:MAG TPA: crosslink repair DNA glycosylase YcaQ family protein [Terriglobales bacterium]|nr:crosslink repair DNA glycosylase YcaQ family protein [Terriglobales bacterium]
MQNPLVQLTSVQARRIWLHAQRLDTTEPFGSGPKATPAAVAHLGYLQIDTIYVIERSHHHILYTRIPTYRREHLHQAQSIDKTVFEYWTHALSYLPTETLRFYVRDMRQAHQDWQRRNGWFGTVSNADLRRVLSRIRRHGALTIRDIEDEPVEKDYAWASRKPSKRVLELAFYKGLVTISQRAGMLKTYELMTRHFGWDRLPRAATERETLNYLLDRALQSQGIVSVDSICHLDAPRKLAMRRLLESRVRRKELTPVQLEGAGQWLHWVRPETLDAISDPAQEQIHILSPFDPLIIQRKRLRLFFDYEYRFEAYVPKHKRVFGYFVCPVLIGDRIVAALDLKTDRLRKKLMVQRWHWIGRASRAHQQQVEAALHKFEQFQLGRS